MNKIEINKSEIIKLKSNIDNLAFYSKYLKLKKIGKNYFANCPFHNENAPSFQINIETGFYRCYGCSNSGDIIDFYKNIENKSFIQSVLDLAEEYNIKLEIDEKVKEYISYRKKLFNANRLVYNIYNKNLKENKNVLKYLYKDRNLSLTSINKFKLCASSSNQLSNIDHLYKQYFKDLNLVMEGENGNEFDYFRTERAIFPFVNEYGQIIGFSSRALNDKEMPKYLHTKDSEIFLKSDEIYGIHQALDSIKKKDSVIIVEGYMDCIRSHENGFTNTVALAGLNMSENVAKKLGKLTKNFYICLDNDEAGQNALKNIYDALKKNATYPNIMIIKLPKPNNVKKMDLDEFLSYNSSDMFKSLIKGALSYNEFIINETLKTFNYKTIEDKKTLIYMLREHIRCIPNIIDRNQYITLIANKLSIPENDVFLIMKDRTNLKEVSHGSKEKQYVTAQKLLLALLFSSHDKHFISILFDEYDIKNNLNKNYRALYGVISEKVFNMLTEDKITDTINIIYSMFNENETVKNILADIVFKVEEVDAYSQEELKLFVEDLQICLKRQIKKD